MWLCYINNLKVLGNILQSWLMVCAACSTAVVLWAGAAGLAAASGSASNRAAFVRRGNAGALVT